MDSRFKNKSSSSSNNRACTTGKPETDIAQENTSEVPSSLGFNLDSLVTSTSSPKKSRRATQKRVVQIPVKEIEGSRLKGESNNTPPSDSWAWRKYGQKPIKGSPYPRGYYRCSSSKGCPARKQVERSRVDPTMLVVTYSCDHNHPWPPSRSNHHHYHKSHVKREPEHEVVTGKQDPEPEAEAAEKFADLGDESMITTADEFGWFGEMEATAATSSVVLKSPLFMGDDADVASMYLPMREEDESLFADLGELPECSVVFRRGLLEREEQHRRCEASWCGTTS